MSSSPMSAPLPAPEYRALMLFDQLPEGCLAQPVPDTAFAPHQRPGEWVVVDPQDTEPVNGEVFLVRISSPLAPGGYRLRFVQLWGRQMTLGRETSAGLQPEEAYAWMMHFQIRQHFGPMSIGQVTTALRAGTMGLCDGPLHTEGLRKRIVGRVVGLLAPSYEEPRRTAMPSQGSQSVSQRRKRASPRRAP